MFKLKIISAAGAVESTRANSEESSEKSETFSANSASLSEADVAVISEKLRYIVEKSLSSPVFLTEISPGSIMSFFMSIDFMNSKLTPESRRDQADAIAEIDRFLSLIKETEAEDLGQLITNVDKLFGQVKLFINNVTKNAILSSGGSLADVCRAMCFASF